MFQRQREKLNSNKHNMGFSFVELMVVIAIMAVLIGAASISYVVVSKSNVKKAASYIDNAITNCREKSMTKTGEWSVRISDGLVEIVHDGETVDSKELPSNVDVYVSEINGDLSENMVGEDYDSVSVFFKTLSGEVKTVEPESIKGSGTCCYIMCRYKDKKQYTIRLYYSTGKHSVSED